MDLSHRNNLKIIIIIEPGDYMHKGFSKISTFIKTYLTYSEIFGQKASIEEIKNDIRRINIDEALFILAQFSVLNDKGLLDLKNKLKPFLTDKEFVESFEAFDLSNLMYTMKWFIAYGTRKPYFSFENNFRKPFNIFLTVLKISDYMVDSMDNTDDVENVVLKSSLFIRNTQIDRSLLREHIMFEELARSPERFEPNDYLDIHKVFEEKYGYSIVEYVSTVFTLNISCVNKRSIEEVLYEADWGINPSIFFDKITMKKNALSIYNDLCIDPMELRDWARSTINNPYDFEPLLIHPIFTFNDCAYPSSPGNMNSIIFDGLFFRIRNCFGKNDTSFFDFFGRLFELYVSVMLKDAVSESSLPYNYIEEFKYGKDNGKRSSDAYVAIGKSMIIFECKSGRIRKETKVDANEVTTETDFHKYVMSPIMQANKAFSEITELNPNKFDNVNKVAIISVSSQSFPRLPKYHELINKREWQSELHPSVKIFDYSGLNDIEAIAYFMSTLKISIYRIIQTKISIAEFIPYPNYFYEKYGEIKRLNSHNQKLKEIFELLKNTLGIQGELNLE